MVLVCKTRRDAGSQFTKNANCLNPLNITVNPPYLKLPKTPVNNLSLPVKDYYMTGDVCKVLGIKPDTFRERIYKGFYPEYQKIGVKRIFTLEQIMKLVEITNKLIRKGTFSVGN